MAALADRWQRVKTLAENGNGKTFNLITLAAVILGTLISVITIITTQASTNQRFADYVEFQKEVTRDMKAAIELQNERIMSVRIEQAKQNQKYDDLKDEGDRKHGSINR